ncbi:hypothetical protein GCM10027049_30230 [Mucilaginibacter puniceus]
MAISDNGYRVLLDIYYYYYYIIGAGVLVQSLPTSFNGSWVNSIGTILLDNNKGV